MVSHQFIHIPECPVPLIGRDLLCKLQATLKFKPTGKVEAHFEDRPVTLLCPVREEWRLHAPLIAGLDDGRYHQDTPFAQQRRNLMAEVPNVWAEVNPGGLAVNAIPIWIELKPNAQVVNQGQYHIPYAARHSMHKHLQKLLQQGVLRPVRSAWNTPLLPVKKPGTSEYRPVQDLRKVNNQILTTARAQSSLRIEGKNILIVPDLTETTARKRKAFLSMCPHLKSMGACFGLQYPARMTVTIHNSTKTYDSPEQLQAFIDQFQSQGMTY
ncbi:uncharacterized protein LOC115478327 [Microcaecilia unicolor]|uniref:Uncharacterized protein LOC115478327 n=1 Tax=Microcaecilia unicolor TaxID=1415580 RepID=A0A6P7YWI7_9AMPH|nr:uncharacterized protein LOC115478327 [Microcaecilia unicolor]